MLGGENLAREGKLSAKLKRMADVNVGREKEPGAAKMKSGRGGGCGLKGTKRGVLPERTGIKSDERGGNRRVMRGTRGGGKPGRGRNKRIFWKRWRIAV